MGTLIQLDRATPIYTNEFRIYSSCSYRSNQFSHNSTYVNPYRSFILQEDEVKNPPALTYQLCHFQGQQCVGEVPGGSGVSWQLQP